MGAVTFRYYYVFTIPTSPAISYDPGLTSRCGRTAKANPPALSHVYVPVYVPVFWSTDGCVTAALKAVVWGASQHLRDLRIARALASHQDRWGLGPVTGHAAASVFGRSPVSGRSSYTLFQGGLSTALLSIPLRDVTWPLISC